jgi:hypothetical protein
MNEQSGRAIIPVGRIVPGALGRTGWWERDLPWTA